MRIVLVGGGSGGPVTPLLAVAANIKKQHPHAEFLFLGGYSGPERPMAEQQGLRFEPIVAGKLRRYFSLWNAVTPFLVLAGFFQSLWVLKKFKPDCAFGAGSFVQVPVLWAAKLLGTPILIHQQDVYPSLANKLCSIIANNITVTFEESLHDFTTSLGFFYKRSSDKVLLTGNPFRASLHYATKAASLEKFHFRPDLPIVLVMGGGTGSSAINKLVSNSLPVLMQFVQVLHITGHATAGQEQAKNYRQFPFLADMALAYAAADLVVCRAGLSTITELSNLSKIGIIIPMPNSHQELNGLMLANRGAAIVVKQDLLDGEKFVQLIRRVLIDGNLQQKLRKNISQVMPKNSADQIAKVLVQLIKKL